MPTLRKVRSFSELSPDDLAAFRKLESEFRSTPDAGRRAAILEEIAGSSYGPEAVALAQQAMNLGDDALTLQAIDLLAGNTSASILPALETALENPSPSIRQQAVLAANQVRDDAVIPFFGKVFGDRDPSVRMSGFNALDEQSVDRRIKVFGQAMEAPTADVQVFAVGSLQVESTPRSIETLIPALDSPSSELRAEARFSLEFQLGQDFPNAAAAKAWWAANKQKFDNDLAPRE